MIKYIDENQHYTNYINAIYHLDKDTAKNIELLDKYDFSEFLGEGRSLYNLCDAIEEKYDKEFKKLYDMYVFENLDTESIIAYFRSRYNIWFQEYTDWVVRHNDGPYSKVGRRPTDSD